MNPELIQRRFQLLERRAIDTRRFVWMAALQGQSEDEKSEVRLLFLEDEVYPWGPRIDLTQQELFAFDIQPQIGLVREAFGADYRVIYNLLAAKGLGQLKQIRKGIQIAENKGWKLIYERDLIFSEN